MGLSRIWYADGSVVDFCSRDEWEAAPAVGVIAISQPGLMHRPGAGDLYWMDEDGYVNHSNSYRSLSAREYRLGVGIHRKFGETISYRQYKALDVAVVEWTRANMEDCDCGC